jgi:UDP-N-acetylglucosamine--N-acetylmuramyl-(pentapeptide) pyrophosphoryl-undecaprenol N-acetylglucosamine transferase
LSFKEARKHIKSRNVHFCGTPLIDSLNSLSKTDAKEMMGFDANKKTILVMGGSQGAQTINDALKSIVRDLVEDYGLQVIHQTGEKI